LCKPCHEFDKPGRFVKSPALKKSRGTSPKVWDLVTMGDIEEEMVFLQIGDKANQRSVNLQIAWYLTKCIEPY
jgi:hypothetical protein